MSLSPAALDIEARIALLDPASEDARLKVAELRTQLDAAWDTQQITLHDWRALVDRLADVRGQCEGACDVRGNNGHAFGLGGRAS